MTGKSLYGARKYNFSGDEKSGILTVHLIVYSDFDTSADSYAESFLIHEGGDVLRDRFKKVSDRWYRLEDGSESDFPKDLIDAAHSQRLTYELIGCQPLDWN
jgi:hypothetical protein